MIPDLFTYITFNGLMLLLNVFPRNLGISATFISGVDWVVEQAYMWNWVFPIDTVILIMVQVFLLNFLIMSFRLILWAFRAFRSLGANI